MEPNGSATDVVDEKPRFFVTLQEHNPTTHEISATNVSQQGGLTLPAHAVLPVTTVADTSAPQPSPAVNTQGYIMRDMTHEPLAGHPRYRRIKDINSGERLTAPLTSQ
jgi:hypothetical protein